MAAETKDINEITKLLWSGYNEFILGDPKSDDNSDFEPDYISFATIVDVYLSKPFYEYKDSDALAILTTLYEILDNDHKLTYEIGWDLPGIFINLVLSKEYHFVQPLGTYSKVSMIFQLFNLLARHGNPKELLLKCQELFRTISLKSINDKFQEIGDEKILESYRLKLFERFFNIQFHILCELQSACLKRIATTHPSKFLSMVVTNFISFLNNNAQYMQNPTFQLRRIYIFSREYVPPVMTDDLMEDIADKEKLIADEAFLQGKLLNFLLTKSVEICSKFYRLNVANDYYRYLKRSPTKSNIQQLEGYNLGNLIEDGDYVTEKDTVPAKSEFTQIVQRIFELLQSFDVDFVQLMEDSIKSTNEMILPLLELNDEELVTKTIFEKSNEAFYESLISDKALFSKMGSLILLSYAQCFDAVDDDAEFTYNVDIKDTILLSLRLLIPLLTIREQSGGHHAQHDDILAYQKSLEHFADVNSLRRYAYLEDLAMFWNLHTISQQSLAKNEIRELTSGKWQSVCKIYLQCLFSSINNPSLNKNYKKIVMTYIFNFMTMSHEDFLWDFLIGGIQNCPYVNVKIEMINILKQLITRKKVIKDSGNVESLESQLNKVKLSGGPPQLPSRDFLQLNTARKEELWTVLNEMIDETFENLEQQQLQVLLTFLNLVYILRQKLDEPKLGELVVKLDECIEGRKEDFVELKFLKMFNERLRK